MLDDLLKKFSKEHSFLTKEKLYSMYEIVAKGIEDGHKDLGVWTKAYADAEGGKDKQKALYISLMVERLVEAEAVILEKANKQKKEMRRARFLEEKKLKEQKEKEEKKKQEEIKQRNKKYRPKQSDESKKNFNLEREKHSRELLEQKIAQSESELSKNIITKHPYLSGLALLIFLFYVLPKILP